MEKFEDFGAIATIACRGGRVLRLTGRNRWAEECFRNVAARFDAEGDIARRVEAGEISEACAGVIMPIGVVQKGIFLRVDGVDPSAGTIDIGVVGLPFHADMISTTPEEYAAFAELVPEKRRQITELWRLATLLWTRDQRPERIIGTAQGLVQMYCPASSSLFNFYLYQIEDNQPRFSLDLVPALAQWGSLGEAA